MNKRIIFFSISLLVLQVNSALGQISVADTRNDDFSPIHYNKEVQFEFKYAHKVQSPVTSRFIGLMTFAPWGDNSGGAHYQLNFSNGDIFYRTGLPQNSTWEDWNKLVIAKPNGNVGIGVSSPFGKLDVAGLTYLRAASRHDVELEQLRVGRSDQDIRYHSIFSSHSEAASGNFLKFSLHTGGAGPFTAQNTVMTLLGSGNVGIGTTAPDSKLSVNGTIRAKEVKVETTNWPDYVFLPDYSLIPLDELESYVTKNGHLPNIPTEADVQQDGLKLAEINAKLLEKVEELTLYLIDTHQRIKELEKLGEKVKYIEERLNELDQ